MKLLILAFLSKRCCRTFIFFVLLLVGSKSGYSQNTISASGPTTFCQGGSVTLTANPTGSSYQWKLNGTNTVTTASYVVNQSGVVDVTVNGTAYAPITITVNPKPIPTFTANNSGACSGTIIQFNSNVTVGTAPFTYLWNFGDGTTSTAQNPAQGLTLLGCGTAPANLNNTLTVTDANGCSATVTNAQSILRAPDVQLADSNVFSPFRNCDNSPTAANPNFRIKLSNISPSASCVTSYSIDWGDGSVQTGLTAASFPLVHLYTQLGAFNLVFTGFGTNGCNHSKTYIVANQSNPAGGLGTLGATTGLCAPATIPFVISNWQGNSPGTTYLIDYGDGTNITLNHPLNAADTPHTVTHTYTTTSCPGSATFTATLRAKNACDITPYTAGNIQIRIKPNPNFTYPNPACVSQSIPFTNTTVAGYYGPTCSTAAQYSWDFGDPASGAANTSTATNPNHLFSAPGVYTVTISANNPCGSATITKQICVVDAAIPSFTLNNIVGCTPVTITATNTSNTLAACAAPTYTWSVTYTAANCGIATSPVFVFANGTNVNSVNPSFLLSNPGNYAIRLAITNPCGTVTSAIQTVSVKRPPTFTLPNYANACDSVTITPVVTPTNCGTGALTYLWTFMNGTVVTTSTLQNPGSVIFNSLGINEIKVVVTNECGTTTVAKQFSIFQKPTITPTPNDTVCRGTTVGPFPFSSSVTGTTFTWTNNNTAIGLGASGTGNIPGFVAANSTVNPVTATIIVTPLNGCSGTPDTFTITVYPTPVAPVVTTPVSYCQNAAAIPLTATALANHTLSWYTVATGGSASATAPTPATTTVGSTNYYVSQKNAGGCEGPRALIVVTINASPAIATATATNPTSCASATGFITLTGLTPSTSYTVTYTKNGTPVTVTISSNASGSLIIPNLTSGTYDNIRVTRIGCPSNTVGPFSLIDPNPPATPTAGSNSPVCSGGTLSLNANTTAGATYTWSGPNGFNSNLQNPNITNVTTAASGNYSVTITVSGCTSGAGTVAVIVNPVPANVTAGSNSPFCSGDTLKLTSSTTTTGTITYAWTGPNGFVSNLQNPVIPNAAAAASGTYSVVATLGNCSAAPRTVNVTVRPTPTITNISFTNPSSCVSSTGSISLSGLANNTSYTVNYVRNGTSVTATISSNATGILIIPNLTAGTYSNISVMLNTCVSNTVGPFVLVAPNPPATPTAGSNTPVCVGAMLNLTASTTSTGAATYNWTGPNGFTSTSQNPAIINATTAATGNYIVTATINGCTSGAGTVAVVINPAPANVTAGSNGPICSSDTLKLTSSSATTGSITYAWTGPNVFSSNLQNPIIPNASATASGTYSVVATLGNCSAVPRTVNVLVRPTPVITDSSFTNPITCISPTGTISLIGLANNVTYTVNYLRNGTPVTATLLSNASGIITIPGLSPGAYSNINVVLNTCTSNSVGPFVLVAPNPPAAPFAASNSPICISGTLNLTASAIATATYNWTGPNGFISNQQNPAITNATIAASGTYTVTATVNGCVSQPATVAVIVSASAGISNAGPDQQLCDISSTTLSGNNAGSSTGTWTVILPSTATIAQVNNPATAVSNLPPGVTKIVWTVSNGVCQPSRDTVQITNLPALVNTVSPLSTTVCSGQTVTINGAVPTGGSGTYIYQWQRSLDNIIFTNVPGAFSVSLTVSPTVTTYYRRVISSGPCAGSSDTAVISILAGITGNSINANQSICSNTIPDLLLGSLPTGGGGSFTYTWEQSINGGVTWSTIPGATSKDYQPGVLTIPTRYRRNVTTVFCGGPQVSVSNVITVDITPGPTGTLLYNSGYVCPGTPIRMEVIATNAPLIRYVFGNGDSLTTTNTIVTYTYPQPGIYIPYAYLISGNCMIRLTRGDTVKVDRLRTGFRTQVQQICGSTTVNFTDTSNAFFGISNWAWSFGDGTFSSQQNPVRSYTSNGVYNVKLRITGNSNCPDSIIVPVTIVIRNKPVSIIAGDTVACIGQPVSLNAIVQSADPIASYNWDFGNGINATGQNVIASYNIAGVYTVRLISRTQFGCADTVYRAVRVTASPAVNVGPDVTICRGQSIQIGAVGATNWQWSPVQNLSCTTCPNPLANPLFTTSYIVTGSNGALCRANDTIKVEVIQPFNMAVAGTTNLCMGDSVQLFATGAYTYLWSPAASLNNANISNPTATPAATTLYRVVGRDNYNCFTDTDYVRVNVGQYPMVDLGNGATVVAGTILTLNPTIINGPVTRYRWTPPTDLSCANCPRPVATINNNISYKLEVENAFGCISSDTINFKVNCDPNQLFIPNAFSPDGDGTNDILMVRGKGISAVKYFRVFNRWGQLVFERNNVNVNDPQQGWNGTVNGMPAQPDVYVYTAEAVCTAGGTFVYKGNVTLVR